MHEHIAPMSDSADIGYMLNNLMMNVASSPFNDWTFDTIWSVVVSSHSVPNELSSSSESEPELGPWHRISIIAS